MRLCQVKKALRQFIKVLNIEFVFTFCRVCQVRPSLEVVKNYMKGVGVASADALVCGGHVLTKVCLELSWDFSQDE